MVPAIRSEGRVVNFFCDVEGVLRYSLFNDDAKNRNANGEWAKDDFRAVQDLPNALVCKHSRNGN